MKTTIQMLEHSISMVQDTIAVCSSTKNKKEILQCLSSSTAALGDTVKHLQENEKRKFISVRKALLAVSNMMCGMQDGLEGENLSFKDFQASNNVLRNKFFPRIQQALLDEVEAADAQADDEGPVREIQVSESLRNKIKIVIGNTSEMKEAVRFVANSASTLLRSEEAHSQFAELAQHALAAMPKNSKIRFQVVRAPIVPIFPNAALMINPKPLQALGIKHVVIEHVLVLLDQLLLVVNPVEMLGDAHNPLALAHSVVEMLNERGSVKYELVSDAPKAVPNRSPLLMYWILPRQKMSGLSRIMGTPKAKAPSTQWALPLADPYADDDKRGILRKQKEAEAKERAQQAALEKLAQEREARDAARELAKLKNSQATKEHNKQVSIDKKIAAKTQPTAPVKVHKPAPIKVVVPTPPTSAKLAALLEKNKIQRSR